MDMQTVVNVLATDGTWGYEVLDLASHQYVLATVQKALTYPNEYVIALACHVDQIRQQEYRGRELITLSEYLDGSDIVMEPGEFKRFAMAVAKTYKQVYNKTPRKTSRPNAKGQWVLKAYGFTVAELELVDKVLKSFTRSKIPK